jgi:hypothetical protein
VTFSFPGGDEVYGVGDASYAPPGDVPVTHEPGSQIVMFSPAEELAKTEEVIQKNMQAMQGG